MKFEDELSAIQDYPSKVFVYEEEIARLKAYITKLEQLINDHNQDCEEICKLWRENKTCTHHNYSRQCGHCPKDWRISDF